MAELSGYSPSTIYRWEKGYSNPSPEVIKKFQLMVSGGKNFSFIDLFAGIGGFRMAFESIGGTCVFTSEWNKWCQESYRANFDCSHEIIGDISGFPPENIPEHDILLAGFPCQPFSIAGVSKKNALKLPHGFECKKQGNLFFDIAKIIDYHRPRAFLLENVKNLKSHDKGKTYQVIKRTLEEELGYTVYDKVIDAKYWVPQHRERIFLVGFQNEVDFSFENVMLNRPMQGPALADILHPEDGSEKAELPYTTGTLGKVNTKYTLSSHLWKYLQEYASRV